MASFRQIVEQTTAALKKLLKIVFWLVLVFFGAFVAGEQSEVGRLAALAACENAINMPNCVRQKGYLIADPYYPDLTRRWLAVYARFLAGDLGATYQVPETKRPAPKPATPPADQAGEEVQDK